MAVPAGSTQLPSSLIHPDRNNFSPRVGFAWRPLQKGSLVVRGGYGAYYNTSVYNIIAGNMAQQPPFAQSLSVSGSAANHLVVLYFQFRCEIVDLSIGVDIACQVRFIR